MFEMSAAIIQINEEYCNDFVVNLIFGCFLLFSSMIKIFDVIIVPNINMIHPGIHSKGVQVTRSLMYFAILEPPKQGKTVELCETDLGSKSQNLWAL